MKYNAKYDRWVSKDGLVYRYDTKKDKLVLCGCKDSCGYIKLYVKNVGFPRVHRIVYETFIGEIPAGYEIDHINTIPDDNRIINLRLVTHKENMNNPFTLKKKIGNTNSKGKTYCEFGNKFKEHYGITRCENIRLYNKERSWYLRHNKVCSWEVEDKCKS